MGCGIAIVKYLVFVFNLVFAIIGLALLVVGIFFQTGMKNFTSASTESLNAAPILLMFVGCLIFVVSFFGCCGAIKESKCMLITYAVVMIIFLVAQIAIAVFAFMLLKNVALTQHLQVDIEEAFKNYNSTDQAQTYFNNLQENLKCCGVNGPEDWKNNIPSSCCMNQEKQVSCRINDPNISQVGCVEKAKQKVTLVIRSVAYVVLGIGAVEFLGIFFAFCLTNTMRNQYRRGTYA